MKPGVNPEEEVVSTPHDFSRYRRLADSMTDEPHKLSLSWLRMNRWVAVPVPDCIGDSDAERISAAAKAFGISTCIAVTTEPEMDPESFEVQMTTDGLLEFESRLLLRKFLLFPKDRWFAILHEENYFFVIGGPPDFVQTAVGSTVEDARSTFRDASARRFRPFRFIMKRRSLHTTYHVVVDLAELPGSVAGAAIGRLTAGLAPRSAPSSAASGTPIPQKGGIQLPESRFRIRRAVPSCPESGERRLLAV